MKKIIREQEHRQQTTEGGTRGRLRLPGMLSVAVVSGLLSTLSCGSGSSSDDATQDVTIQMKDVPSSPDMPSSPDLPSSADTMAMDTPVMKDAGVDASDGAMPQDIRIDYPVI